MHVLSEVEHCKRLENYSENAAMIKMQILFNGEKIATEGRYTEEDIVASLDAFMVERLHFIKEPDGFYCGTNACEDFSRFGIAFSVLRRESWFMDYADTWLYYNNGPCEDPNDFIVEDFKAGCLAGSSM